MAVSKRLRYEILRRDNHACRYCGTAAPNAVLTVDHVVPTTLGGSDEPTNLVTACSACNSGKSSTPADATLVADVSADALRWSAAIKQATADALAERAIMAEVAHAVFDVFDDTPVPSYHGGGNASQFLPGDFFNSVEQFIAAGLDRVEILDAAYIATSRGKVRSDSLWRYFCGVCWKKIEYRREAAHALIGEAEPAQDGTYASDESYALMQFVELSLVCDGGF